MSKTKKFNVKKLTTEQKHKLESIFIISFAAIMLVTAILLIILGACGINGNPQ